MSTLPTTPEQIKQQYAPIAQSFRRELETLQERPLTQTTRILAVQLDTRAKTFQAQLEAARAELKKPILEAGRKLDAFFKQMADPAVITRSICGSVIGQIDIAERKAAAEEAARRTAEALERAKAEKAREVEMMLSQAAEANDPTLLQAAAVIEATPVEPTIVRPQEYKPVEAGYSTREVPVGTITDSYRLVRWLVESKDRFTAMSDLIEIKDNRLNAYLRKGVQFPADCVDVGKDITTRNRIWE